MKAVGLTKYLPINDPESLVDLQVATPAPSDRDLLVRVEAVSVNPVDTKIRASKSDVEKEPRILGWDAAGTVEATGPAAKLFRLGDAVYYAGSISRPGTNSEFHLVDERIVGRKPANLSFAEAAGLPFGSVHTLDWSRRLKEIFGLSADAEVTREFFLECVHPEDRERVDWAIMQSLSGVRTRFSGMIEIDGGFWAVSLKGRSATG